MSHPATTLPMTAECRWYPFPLVKPNLEQSAERHLCISTPDSEFSACHVAEWNGVDWLDTNNDVIADKVTHWCELPNSPEGIAAAKAEADTPEK